MESSHHHVRCLNLPFFDQLQTFSVAERTLSICHQRYQEYLFCKSQEDFLKICHMLF